MKAVFTCDDVFDILTREPFPSGAAEDEFVESHLAVCHECRQLAEAFRPAVGLFHESMSAGIDNELPMYRGRLKPIIDALPQPKREAVLPARNAFTLIVLVVAASVALVGSAVFATLALNQQVSGVSTVASNVHLHVHEKRDFTMLAALEIPTECRSTTKATDLVAVADIACCTKCHNAGSRVASTEKAILKSSAACVACHDGILSEALSAAQHWRGPAINYDRMQLHFHKSFQVINVRLATGSPAVSRYAQSSSWRFDAVDEILVGLIDARLRPSRAADAATPTGRWAWRVDSRLVKPGYLPTVTCEANRLC